MTDWALKISISLQICFRFRCDRLSRKRDMQTEQNTKQRRKFELLLLEEEQIGFVV